MIKLFNLTQTSTTKVRVDLSVIAIKGYSTFPKAPGLVPYHQMQFSVTPRMFVVEEGLTSRHILHPQSTGQRILKVLVYKDKYLNADHCSFLLVHMESILIA